MIIAIYYKEKSLQIFLEFLSKPVQAGNFHSTVGLKKEADMNSNENLLHRHFSHTLAGKPQLPQKQV